MTRSFRRGSRIGKYRLERRLGDGGSAVVWQARDTVEGRRVALKLVLASVVEEFGKEAVEAEARIAARLEHPRIARVRNADWIDSTFVIVTDLAKSSLDQASSVKRSPDRILSVVLDVAEGLAHAHEKGVLHRDVKPGNVLIDSGGRAALADFGTARLAQLRTRIVTEAGTMGYMAPEQAYGRPCFASDVFSLGLTAYELWAGQLPGWPFEWPFDGAKRFELRCPDEVQPVIKRALSLNLDRRHHDGVEFLNSLQGALHKRERVALAGALVIQRKGQKKGQRTSGESQLSRGVSSERDPFEFEVGWFRKRFGAVLEARFDCYACDGPISESMRHCPWCGSDQNAFGEVTSYALVCPDCERGVRAEWSACPTCSKGRFVPNGRPLSSGKRTERMCKRQGCGAPIDRFMHYCPGCKDRVTRPWRVKGLKGCTRCDWPMAPRWRFCGWCGRRNAQALAVGRGRR